jgi:hypothetical protein
MEMRGSLGREVVSERQIERSSGDLGRSRW